MMNLSRGKRIFCGASGAAILALTGLTALRGDFTPELEVGVVIAILLLAAAATGIDVAHHDAVSAAAPGSPAAPARVPLVGRILCGTLALAVFGTIVAGAAFGPADGAFVVFCVLAALVGAWFARVAVKGEVHGFSRPETTDTSPRFHALADPSRPLLPDAPISGPTAAPTAREAVPAARERHPR